MLTGAAGSRLHAESAVDASNVGVHAATQPAGASKPADQEDVQTDGEIVASDALTTPGLDRIALPIEGRGAAALWVWRPEGYAPGERPPLIVCLHGTDDTAEEILAFWRDRKMRIPAVLAAPQSVGKGWSSGDVPMIEATFDWLERHVWFDRHRVLLAGFSAGGAMTFQMIYHERAPVTAGVAMANYVPPRLTLEEVRARRDLPMFYAVGMADVNYDLMRKGLEFLRSADANVELYHPDLGHVLSPAVGQAAMDWFGELCHRQTERVIAQATDATDIGQAATRIERIVGQARWHDEKQVARAREVLAKLLAPGEADLRRVGELVEERQAVQAVELLRQVARTYGLSRLGVTARRQRDALLSDPNIRQQLADAEARRRAETAMSEYAAAQKMVAKGRLADAAAACRRIIADHGDTPAATRARRLLHMLEGR